MNYFDADGNRTLNRAEWAVWNGAAALYKKPTNLILESELAFNLSDTNQDGFLSAVEIQQFMLNFGGDLIPIKELAVTVTYFDGDKDG